MTWQHQHPLPFIAGGPSSLSGDTPTRLVRGFVEGGGIWVLPPPQRCYELDRNSASGVGTVGVPGDRELSLGMGY